MRLLCTCSGASSSQEINVALSILANRYAVVFGRVEVFPDTGGKDVLISLVPASIDDLRNGWILAEAFKLLIAELGNSFLLLARHGKRVVVRLKFWVELCRGRTMGCRLGTVWEEIASESLRPVGYEVVEFVMLERGQLV
jgi:hypothetical protein